MTWPSTNRLRREGQLRRAGIPSYTFGCGCVATFTTALEHPDGPSGECPNCRGRKLQAQLRALRFRAARVREQ